jgi:hypothetical protein
MILVNNSAPPGKAGSVNGFAQTLCSGLRATAPTMYDLIYYILYTILYNSMTLYPIFILSS